VEATSLHECQDGPVHGLTSAWS